MEKCIFCQIISGNAQAFIVYEDEKTLAFLDKRPQSRGHIQLIPKVHYRWIYDLPDVGSFFKVAQKLIRGIIPVLGASHVTLASYGREVEHAHLWIVPQYDQEVKPVEGRKTNIHDQSALHTLLEKALREEVS